jgi:hypothetical protein
MDIALPEGTFAIAHIVKNFDFKLGCLPNEISRIAAGTVGPNKMPILFSKRK